MTEIYLRRKCIILKHEFLTKKVFLKSTFLKINILPSTTALPFTPFHYREKNMFLHLTIIVIILHII